MRPASGFPTGSPRGRAATIGDNHCCRLSLPETLNSRYYAKDCQEKGVETDGRKRGCDGDFYGFLAVIGRLFAGREIRNFRAWVRALTD